MSQVKILSYYYIDDDNQEEDEETDLTGEIVLPRRGDIIYRRDKSWKVVAVYAAALNDPFPRFRIHLIDLSKPECVN
jgi:hypothetical protein